MRANNSFLFLAALLIGISGCRLTGNVGDNRNGDGNPRPPGNLDELLAALADDWATCVEGSAWERIGLLVPVAPDEDFLSFLGSAPGTVLNEEGIERCGAFFAQEHDPCVFAALTQLTLLPDYFRWLDACQYVFVGTLQDGDACRAPGRLMPIGDSCGSGLRCTVENPEEDACGTCQAAAPLTEGANCSGNVSQCDEGLFCLDERCRSFAATIAEMEATLARPGDSCEENAGVCITSTNPIRAPLACVDGTCQPVEVAQVGEACTSTHPWLGGETETTVCANSIGPTGVGDVACVFPSDDAVSGECESLRGLGEPCSATDGCDSAGYCEERFDEEDVCEPKSGDGSSCSSNAECRSNICSLCQSADDCISPGEDRICYSSYEDLFSCTQP